MTLLPSEDVIDRRGTHVPTTPRNQDALPPVARPERWDCDPLEPDAADDERLTTSPRRLLRLAIAAADAGARFTREGLAHDPAAWMMTPRALFDGMAGMDACQELPHFSRSIILHGLGIGLDADPEAVDALLDAGEDDDVDHSGEDGCPDTGNGDPAFYDQWNRSVEFGWDKSQSATIRPQLLTCWVDFVEASSRVFAFVAMVTERPGDIVERVVGRFGTKAAAEAMFVAGYDHSTVLASAMISDAMAQSLALAAEDPSSPLARGLNVYVEQRFADYSIAA